MGVVKQIDPKDAVSKAAKELLLDWNGEMDAGGVQPTIYSAMRDALLKEVLETNLTEKLAFDAWHPADRGLGSFSNRLKARLVAMIEQDDRSLLLEGDTWPTAVARALSKAVTTLSERLGDDMGQWQWEKMHQVRPKHNLSAAFPELAELLDPPAIPTSGDGDTPLQGGYSPANPATVTSLSVARYSYDPSDWENSLWVVPLGSSGHPGSPHYADQSETWRQVKMIPMGYDWDRIEASCETKQTLEPS
jgi:penicillin amidase